MRLSSSAMAPLSGGSPEEQLVDSAANGMTVEDPQFLIEYLVSSFKSIGIDANRTGFQDDFVQRALDKHDTAPLTERDVSHRLCWNIQLSLLVLPSFLSAVRSWIRFSGGLDAECSHLAR